MSDVKSILNAVTAQIHNELNDFEQLPDDVHASVGKTIDSLRALHTEKQIVGLVGAVLTPTGVRRFSFATEAGNIFLLAAIAKTIASDTSANASASASANDV